MRPWAFLKCLPVIDLAFGLVNCSGFKKPVTALYSGLTQAAGTPNRFLNEIIKNWVSLSGPETFAYGKYS